MTERRPNRRSMNVRWSIYSFLRLDDDGERFPTPGSAIRAN
jgi:hypothetical protein